MADALQQVNALIAEVEAVAAPGSAQTKDAVLGALKRARTLLAPPVPPSAPLARPAKMPKSPEQPERPPLPRNLATLPLELETFLKYRHRWPDLSLYNILGRLSLLIYKHQKFQEESEEPKYNRDNVLALLVLVLEQALTWKYPVTEARARNEDLRGSFGTNRQVATVIRSKLLPRNMGGESVNGNFLDKPWPPPKGEDELESLLIGMKKVW